MCLSQVVECRLPVLVTSFLLFLFYYFYFELEAAKQESEKSQESHNLTSGSEREVSDDELFMFESAVTYKLIHRLATFVFLSKQMKNLVLNFSVSNEECSFACLYWCLLSFCNYALVEFLLQIAATVEL